MARKTVWWLTGIGLIFGALIMRDSIAQRVANAKAHPNVKAFLNTIGKPESKGRYNVIYSAPGTPDRFFTDYSAHPNMRIPFDNPRTGKRDFSTAAGKYQINYPTWLTIQAVAFLPDFSPESQDVAAIWLMQLRGALDYVIAGDFDNAIRVASKTWASLPGSDSGQHRTAFNSVRNTYIQNGGNIA